MRKKIAIPAALAIAAAVPFLAPTIAASQDAPPVTIPSGWLGVGDIATRLAEGGWTLAKIEVELNDGNYEACLVGADGTEVEVRIDPLTGEILSQEAKSCLDDDGRSSSGDDPSGDSSSGDDPSGDSSSGDDSSSDDSSSDDSSSDDSDDDDSDDDDSDDDSDDDDSDDDSGDDDPSGSRA